MKVAILGAGLSGISTAFFLMKHKEFDEIKLFEKADDVGGLCRSIKKDGLVYDIGPHILFSKDKEMLQLMLDMLDKKNMLKRSNQIIFKNRYIQYPFENDLSKLPQDDLDYCINTFLHNPYENYEVTNMIQFFLKQFGEGITNTYLRPYNEKIWKYDPAFMNTTMVERIPKPTKDEIKRSASGETIDGYLHQLYFSYPSTGGIEAVIRGFQSSLNEKCEILLNESVSNLERCQNKYLIKSANIIYEADIVISTIPVQELTKAYKNAEANIGRFVNDLHYNSIIIGFIRTKRDLCGDNFAFMIPEKDIIFHRISKMDFLGESYKTDGASYMVEITYRKNDQIDNMSNEMLFNEIKKGLIKIGFSEKEEEITLVNLTKHPYAYVIYDLNHQPNMEQIRNYYCNEGVILTGRFGNFEYWNMDKVLREALKSCNSLIDKIESLEKQE